MSAHWKSTPKYWCKHCTIYVKDTPLERNQHESTGKHQGNLKRFLNGIQKNHARSEREKDQAKAEVDRLTRIAGDSSSFNPTTSIASVKPATTATLKPPSTTALSVADQKRQWAQLAQFGVAVPGSGTVDLSMPSGWQTLSRKVIPEPVDAVDDKLNIGVRKRKFEGQEEEEEVGEVIVNRGWGSTTKTYPGSTSTSDDLDSLISSSLFNKKKRTIKEEEDIREDLNVDTIKEIAPTTGSKDITPQDNQGDEVSSQPLKTERPSEPTQAPVPAVKAQPSDEDVSSVLHEDKAVSAPIFKKRRPKNNPTSGIT